jgi:hypothetical protein
MAYVVGLSPPPLVQPFNSVVGRIGESIVGSMLGKTALSSFRSAVWYLLTVAGFALGCVAYCFVVLLLSVALSWVFVKERFVLYSAFLIANR